MFKNLNPGALGFKVPFLEIAELARLGGFQGIDLNVLEVKEILKIKSVAEIRESIAEKGLVLGGWGVPVDFRGDEEKFQKGLGELPTVAEVACAMGCLRVFTWIRPFSDELPFERNFQLHVHRLGSIADILSDHECSLGLEFVAPKTSRINHRYEFIHTMDGILQLCKAIEKKNVGLLLDSWHWYTSHGTLDHLERLKGDQVVYVHVNDAPAGIPRDEQIDNVRCLPGETGVIDIVGFLKALERIGYDGPVTPEPFERKLREMPVQEAVRKVGEALDNVWRSAGL